jgi:hypothetical protein
MNWGSPRLRILRCATERRGLLLSNSLKPRCAASVSHYGDPSPITEGTNYLAGVVRLLLATILVTIASLLPLSFKMVPTKEVITMSDSILNSTKKVLGIEADYSAFDLDILMHINSVFTTLNQLGVGPVSGFMIEDAEPTWFDFLGANVNLNSVKSYVYLRVRLLFDPPSTSYHLTAIKEQVKELEWRLNVAVDTRPLATAEDAELIWVIDDHEPFPVDAENGEVGFDPVTGDVWRNVE